MFVSAFIYFKQFFGQESNLKNCLLNTFVFLCGYNTFGYYWLTFTLKTFGGLFFPLNVIGWQLFSLIIAPHFYVFTIIFFLLKKNRVPFISEKSIFISPFLALIFSLLEYFVPQQFPAHFGHTWLVLAPYLKLSQFFGPAIYSFITITLALELARSRRLSSYSFIKIPSFYLSLLLILINFSYSSIEEFKSDDKINIRLVQANIGNDLKLKSEGGSQLELSEVVDTFEDLSKKSTTLDGLNLIIWPETSYPRLLDIASNKIVPYDFARIIRSTESEYFVGTYDIAADLTSSDFETQYNTATFVDKNGKIKQTYHKRVLIPFGEGLPFGSLNKYFAKYIKNISFFAKGVKFTFFQAQNYSFISLICYEVLFPEYVRNYLNNKLERPNFIINLTNDSWYGRYSEQEQHLFLSKWRALEFNLPIIRSTNTGISTLVMNNGIEKSRLGNYQQGILDIELPIVKSSKTIFQRFGILGFMMLVGVFFIILALFRKAFIK